jgi:hypothetical protein
MPPQTSAPDVATETDMGHATSVIGYGIPFGNAIAISTSAEGAHSVAAVDMDGDGDQDVISASRSDGKLRWFESNGANPPTRPRSPST